MIREKPTVIVTGFARCGTTMMMRMLHAGGMPVIADGFASFESHLFRVPRYAIDWGAFSGHAIKVLDPHRWNFPISDNLRFIFMKRDPKEQAKSHAKLLAAQGIQTTSLQRKAIELSLRLDYRSFFLKHPTLHMDFERVLWNPRARASQIPPFLGAELDLDKMAAVVRSRRPQCLPTLDYEMQLIAEYQQQETSN